MKDFGSRVYHLGDLDLKLRETGSGFLDESVRNYLDPAVFLLGFDMGFAIRIRIRTFS